MNRNTVLRSEAILAQVIGLSTIPNHIFKVTMSLLSKAIPSLVAFLLDVVCPTNCTDFGKSGTRFECSLKIHAEVNSNPCLKFPDISSSSEDQLSCMKHFKEKVK